MPRRSGDNWAQETAKISVRRRRAGAPPAYRPNTSDAKYNAAWKGITLASELLHLVEGKITSKDRVFLIFPLTSKAKLAKAGLRKTSELGKNGDGISIEARNFFEYCNEKSKTDPLDPLRTDIAELAGRLNIDISSLHALTSTPDSPHL